MKALELVNYGLTALLVLFGIVTLYTILTPGVPAGGSGVVFVVVLLVMLGFEHVTGVA